MAYISFQPKDYFNTSIWTGTGSDPLTVTGVGFQSDITWIKRRELNHHRFMDSVRGATYEMYPDLNSTSYGESQGLKSWNTDGYALGNNAGYNANGGTYAGWTWKGGTTSVPSGGSITPSSVSYHVSGGVGVYKYTGTGSNATIAHGLGKEPSMIIVKRTDATSQWSVYFKALGNTQHMILDTDGNSVSSANYWNNTSPTSSVFTIGAGTDVNASGGTYIAVAYCNVPGYSHSGKYTGNGNANGEFVYTGFKPSWLMIKKHGASSQWIIFDNKRGYNGSNGQLYADSNEAEGSSETLDLVSNGFKCRATDNGVNNSGSDYFYIAFADEPFVASNGDPATAR
tara:strand:- start:1052 stop:2074 length:1023 start_codon:yes stop_codon:yes gene_type:complete